MIDITIVVFYEFALLLLVAACGVVLSKSPVKSVLCLVLAFFASAALWLIQQAEFLALALIFVYVGAVMTLFLFVVLMLNVNELPRRAGLMVYIPILFMVSGLFVYSYYHAITEQGFAFVASPMAKISNGTMLGSAENIAEVLYSDYLLAFELVAVLLLIAIVAAISLAQRNTNIATRRQNVAQQIKANATDRVTLIDMEAEQY